MNHIPPVPQADYSRYQELEQRIRKLMNTPPHTSHQAEMANGNIASAWTETEDLKNKYGGSIPPNPEDQAR